MQFTHPKYSCIALARLAKPKTCNLSCCSPPVRRQWGPRDRPVLHGSLHQDENFHHSLFSQQSQQHQHQQQIPLDESRQYSHTSAPPRMLHPATHPPQQSPIMVDLHEQVGGSLGARELGQVLVAQSLLLCARGQGHVCRVHFVKILFLCLSSSRCTKDQSQYLTQLPR